MSGRSRARSRDLILPVALALLGCAVVLAVGFLTYGPHVSRFIHAGTYFVPAREGLVRQAGAGYDGQFVYRLALAPFDLSPRAHGITFDTPLRAQRIGLPLLAWLLSGGGRPAALPVVLLLINVASIGVIAGCGGVIARRGGHAAAWGVLLAAPCGLEFGLLHDLTEPLEVALVLVALLLYWEGRVYSLAAVLAAAALTRETALIFVAAIACHRLRDVARDRRPALQDLTWLVPVVVWAGWQACVDLATGGSAVGKGGSDNLGPPFDGIAGLIRSLPHAAWHQWPLFVVQVAFLAYLVVLAAPLFRAAPRPVPVTLLLYGLFSLFLSKMVWAGYDDLRFLIEPTVFVLVALLASRGGTPRLRQVAVPASLVWALSLAFNRH